MPPVARPSNGAEPKYTGRARNSGEFDDGTYFCVFCVAPRGGRAVDLSSVARPAGGLRRVVGAVVGCSGVAHAFAHAWMGNWILFTRGDFQLSALHGDDLSRVSHTGKLREVQDFYAAYHAASRGHRHSVARVVLVAAVDFHALHLLEPVALHWIRAAFWASYLMLLASFETGGSSDPLILSLGLPAKFTLPARLVLGAAFAIFSAIAFWPLIRRMGARALAAPLTLALTQFLWFVLPTLLELRANYQIPQTRYSSGILAVLHSAQYIWITSYFQEREARAAGQSRWRMPIYFLTLIAGGIALFIPGPWLVSRILHYDFTTSFLIFTAVVNIHHFILDGALWKLRDSRVSSLLIDRSAKAGGAAPPHGNPTSEVRSVSRTIFAAPAFGIAIVVLLLAWGLMDQIHFALGTDDENLSSLERAASMNPYDSMLQARIASAETRAGRKGDAVQSLTRAVAINPHNAALQHACTRAMLEDGRYADAYAHYAKMLTMFPRDVDALVNYGVLAARLGHPDDAIDSWEKAVDVDPGQPNPHLYLAEAFEQRGEHAAAANHWAEFLRFAAAHPGDTSIAKGQEISATIQLADDESLTNQSSAALAGYLSAVALAQGAGDARLEGLAFVHLADLQEKQKNAKAAASSYQRALALDAKAGDVHSEALDWFNYGQFLRRHGQPDDLAYACVLRAEALLAGSESFDLKAGGGDLTTVRAIKKEMEARLGTKATNVQANLPALLARAAALPPASF
jgi:tetratricopeptide (TPR) repeat protein